MAIDNEAHCLNLLRDIDRDRYLACLLSPAEHRPALAALYAFNAEIARVRDLVREPLPGEVRLQYWRDLLEGQAHGETAANPLAQALLAAIERYRLPTAPLVAMIDARIFDLYDDPMESRAMFEGYAGETASALIQLSTLVLDPQAGQGASERVGHAGVAQAVAGLLLLLPSHRARGQVYLPQEILGATGLDRDSFLAGDPARLAPAIEAFAGFGMDHLRRAATGGRVPASLVAAFLPVAFARPVLAQAARHGGRLFSRDIRPPQWRRQLRMLTMLATRRI